MRPSLPFPVSSLSLCFFLHLLVALRLRSLRFHSPRLCRVAVFLIQTNVSLSQNRPKNARERESARLTRSRSFAKQGVLKMLVARGTAAPLSAMRGGQGGSRPREGMRAAGRAPHVRREPAA